MRPTKVPSTEENAQDHPTEKNPGSEREMAMLVSSYKNVCLCILCVEAKRVDIPIP